MCKPVCRSTHHTRMTPTLTILITYCTNERMFIDDLLVAALHAADTVCVAIGRRLFDGREEDAAHVQELSLRYPSVHFTWFEVPDVLLATPIVLHNSSRVAARDVTPVLDAWVMLLDGDEVPRNGGRPLRDWWVGIHSRLEVQNVYKLSNRWFFLHPRLVSDMTEDSIVMVHGSHLTDNALTHPRERDGICMTVCGYGGTCVRGMLGEDGKPMFDHFSWVRESRVLLLAKVANWGHSKDRDWSALINQAWIQMEQGKLPDRDFVHGRRLKLLRQ